MSEASDMREPTRAALDAARRLDLHLECIGCDCVEQIAFAMDAFRALPLPAPAAPPAASATVASAPPAPSRPATTRAERVERAAQEFADAVKPFDRQFLLVLPRTAWKAFDALTAALGEGGAT